MIDGFLHQCLHSDTSRVYCDWLVFSQAAYVILSTIYDWLLDCKANTGLVGVTKLYLIVPESTQQYQYKEEKTSRRPFLFPFLNNQRIESGIKCSFLPLWMTFLRVKGAACVKKWRSFHCLCRRWTSGRCWWWTTSTRSGDICSTSCWAGDFLLWSSLFWSSSCSVDMDGPYTACTDWCKGTCECDTYI